VQEAVMGAHAELSEFIHAAAAAAAAAAAFIGPIRVTRSICCKASNHIEPVFMMQVACLAYI